MSVKVTFRNSLPPLIRSPLPSREKDYFKNTPNSMPKKGRTVNNSENAKAKVQEIIKELNDLIGLNMVKKLITELEAYVEIQKIRQRENLIAEPLVLHMVFSGNPGSGKTTVARLVGRLFKEMGVLTKGHIIECERADLVGEYIGHTANKTRDIVKKALGGVLFIDEAYSLARGGEKDFGKESIDALVKAMEDHKEDLVLILAGYRVEMNDFIRINPGLRSRFPIHINFPDYSIDELVAIGELMLRKRQYEFSIQAKTAFRKLLENMHYLQHNGNARMVRNIIEKTIRKQAVRLYRQSNPSREDLICIEAVDLCCDEI